MKPYSIGYDKDKLQCHRCNAKIKTGHIKGAFGARKIEFELLCNACYVKYLREINKVMQLGFMLDENIWGLYVQFHDKKFAHKLRKDYLNKKIRYQLHIRGDI